MKKQPKDPVRLRRRLMPSGTTSLYLDIYVDGRRTYEYLRLYLHPERNRRDRDANRETLQLAEAVRAKRLVEIREGRYGFGRKSKAETIMLDDYFESVIADRQRTATTRTVMLWHTAQRYLRDYIASTRRVALAQAGPEWLKGFRDYLLSLSLRPNTRGVYYSKICAALNQAERDQLIPASPVRSVKGIRGEETERLHLTLPELRRLAATPCPDDGLRRGFLFSCLTGLRHCDVEALTWGDVDTQDGFTRITFRQRKTRGQEYTDITPEARALMGEPAGPADRIFHLPSVDTASHRLAQWVHAAGIDKHITFHCARHTFAVLMLDIGTDIYTVSKLLGHRDLKTTQIYARILDKNKQAAVSRIPAILPDDDTDDPATP